MRGSPVDKAARIARVRKGRISEWAAALLLLLKGYRILQWRALTAAGEIDLVGVRGRRLAFVEVKYRRNLNDARAAISPDKQRRLIRAAQSWVASRPRYRDYEQHMDAIFICPKSWPRHEQDVFYFD